jgi:hypothetical protein
MNAGSVEYIIYDTKRLGDPCEICPKQSSRGNLKRKNTEYNIEGFNISWLIKSCVIVKVNGYVSFILCNDFQLYFRS